MPDNLSEIDQILHALGKMVVAWGHYEDIVFILMCSVIDLHNGSAQLALRNTLDLKTATDIIKNTAIIEPKIPAQEHLLALVSWTDRPLREDRNRFVHDPLYSGGGRYEQNHYVTRSKKPQAFQPEKVSVITGRPITSELVRKFIAAIHAAESYAGTINHHFSDEPEDYKALSEVEKARDALADAIASYTLLAKSLTSTK